MTVTLEAVAGLPRIGAGADLGALIAGATGLSGRDVVVVAQKIVSKAEGRTRRLDAVQVTERAAALAERLGRDPRFVQLVLDESVRIVRDNRVLIVETHHGFVCANAGIDQSNVEEPGTVTLLPVDCDASAARIAARIHECSGVRVGVIVSDTFGRAWRVGQCNVALGVSGIAACADLRGTGDLSGRVLDSTIIAVADEIAAAAGLLMQKHSGTPAVVVRGLELPPAAGSGRDLLRPADLDLFR